MRASGSDSSEPLLLVHRSARERCCLMTSRRDVIPHAHKTGIWCTSVTWSVTCHGELRAHCLDNGGNTECLPCENGYSAARRRSDAVPLEILLFEQVVLGAIRGHPTKTVNRHAGEFSSALSVCE